jgi:single-strand DNA-binding protein
MNVALVRGVVTRDPDIRSVANPSTKTEVTLASFDLAVHPEGGPRSTVPVVVPLGGPRHQAPAAGDEILVVGQVQRRFFRVGGATQSRTEVIADEVVAASDRRRVRRLLTSAAARLAE